MNQRPMRVVRPRICPACKQTHPPLTTCAQGWSPWDGEDILIPDRRPPSDRVDDEPPPEEEP